MKMKKIVALSLSLMLLVSVFTGCSSQQSSGNAQDAEPKTTEDNASGEAKESEELEGFLVTTDPLELTFHMHFRDTYVYKEDWPVYQKAAELTNINLKGVAPTSATNSREVFNLMMGSGDLPDIVAGDRLKDEFIRYGLEGAFIPLNDLIEEHAPNIKAFLKDRPDVKEYATGPDGNMYFMPYIPDGEVSRGYYLRQDWLDNLGLESPKTVDELYEVLKAFRNDDPNGNGQKDEIPYFNRHWQEAIRLANLWGAKTGLTSGHEKRFYVAEDGSLKHGFVQPEFKEGMKNIAKWYDEGLIDPEIFTRGGKSRDILLGDNVGGFTHDWFGSTASYNDSLKDQVQGFNFIPIAPPADVNGKQWEEDSRDTIKPDGWAITVENENPIETIKYFDFFFTEEGRRLANFGIEGQQYDLVDGKAIFKDEILNGDKPVTSLMWEIGAQVPIGFFQDFSYEEQWLNPNALEGMQMYEDNNYVVDRLPALTFNFEEQKIYEDKWPAIQTYMDETIQNWILGGESVEQGWDKYINRLDELGLQEIAKIHESAYARFMKNQ